VKRRIERCVKMASPSGIDRRLWSMAASLASGVRRRIRKCVGVRPTPRPDRRIWTEPGGPRGHALPECCLRTSFHLFWLTVRMHDVGVARVVEPDGDEVADGR